MPKQEKEREKFPDIDINEAKKLLVELVPQVGDVLMEYFHFHGFFASRSKCGMNFTTEADDMVDKFLIRMIKHKFPQSQFLTEETAPDSYYRFINSKNLWVIDSIDGTTNFSRKREHFGISVALVSKGIPRLGVVCLPAQGELYYATENSKAFLEKRESFLKEEEIHVSKIKKLNEAWVESGISWDMDKRDEFARDWIPKIVKNVRAFTMSGSTVFDMAKVAKGQVDAFVYCGIKPWDQAATGLIIQKAGGVITSADGKPWNVFERDIVASNGLLHNQILEIIAKKD